mmetsp:Transcript_20661/g.48767  ORF Transcript_20661/g.48767 Transcript_20661/m.48767 type:complete len:316 (+) Transcript_20661:291-1238(+)
MVMVMLLVMYVVRSRSRDPQGCCCCCCCSPSKAVFGPILYRRFVGSEAKGHGVSFRFRWDLSRTRTCLTRLHPRKRLPSSAFITRPSTQLGISSSQTPPLKTVTGRRSASRSVAVPSRSTRRNSSSHDGKSNPFAAEKGAYPARPHREAKLPGFRTNPASKGFDRFEWRSCATIIATTRPKSAYDASEFRAGDASRRTTASFASGSFFSLAIGSPPPPPSANFLFFQEETSNPLSSSIERMSLFMKIGLAIFSASRSEIPWGRATRSILRSTSSSSSFSPEPPPPPAPNASTSFVDPSTLGRRPGSVESWSRMES